MTTVRNTPNGGEAQALDVAHRLITAGVPVFVAPPIPDRPGHYRLPSAWQRTQPSEALLAKWRPGWALGAVGGHTVDFLDVDPRSGGDASFAELRAAGHVPITFGRQRTASGGEHYILAGTGERKAVGFMPGLDLLAGEASGEGRGFIYLAPTIRPSKDPSNFGELNEYVWLDVPDLSMLVESPGTAFDSTHDLIARVRAFRARERIEVRPAREEHTPNITPNVPIGADDPFLTASMIEQRLAGGAHYGDRSFTVGEAQDFVRPFLLRLQEARIGSIEETANVAASTLAHFVPAFWTADEAFELLEQSLAQTAYDPNGPSDWRAEKFRAVLDGTRPPIDNWKAIRKPDEATPPAAVVEAAPGEEALSTLEKLRAKLVSATDLANQPAPEPLIWGLLDLDSEAWLIGAPGSLKSFVALDMAGHVGRGADWQGHRTTRRDVLYLAAEGARGLVLRARAWMKRHGGDMAGVTFLPYPVQVQSADGQWAALVQIAKELQPGLIIIDTQARVTVGMDENTSKDMGILIDAIGRLKRATGACVVTVHHTGRNGGDARGSSALDGAQDTELKVVRAEPRSSLQAKIIMDKQKDMAEEVGGVPLRFEVVDLGVDPVTQRELSSLVLCEAGADPFLAGQGYTELEVDTEIWHRVPHPEDWTKQIVPYNAKVKRRTLQVLADHGHLRGLTKAEARRIVSERWEEVRNGSWDAVWADVTSRDAVVHAGGERWALDQAILAAARESDKAH